MRVLNFQAVVALVIHPDSGVWVLVQFNPVRYRHPYLHVARRLVYPSVTYHAVGANRGRRVVV